MATDDTNIMKHFLQKHIVHDVEVDDLKDRLSRNIAGLRQLKQECLEISLAIGRISKDCLSDRKDEAGTVTHSMVPLELSGNEEHLEAPKLVDQLRARSSEETVLSQAQLITEGHNASRIGSSITEVKESEEPISENLFESYEAGGLRKFKGYSNIEGVQAEEKAISERVQAYRDYLKKGETEESAVSLLPRVETAFRAEGKTKPKAFSPKRSITDLLEHGEP